MGAPQAHGTAGAPATVGPVAPPPAGPVLAPAGATLASPAASTPTGNARIAWLLLAVACQFCWGIYPAGLRYLQTEGNRPLTSLQLSFLINLMACPALFIGTTLPLWLLQKHRARAAHLAAVQQQHSDASGSSYATAPHANGRAEAQPSAPPLADEGSLTEPLLQRADLEACPPSAAAPAAAVLVVSAAPTRRQRTRVLMATTFFLTALFLAQVFSLLFTTAYLSQMVFLLAPVMVAFMARILFRSPLPPGLWRALLFMLIGCGMVIGSKAAAAGKPSNGALDAPWSPALAHSAAPGALGPAAGSAAAVSAVPVGLWTPQAEDDGLCASIFGEWGASLCGLEDGPGAGIESDGEEGGEGAELSLSKKKHRKKNAGLGLADVIGIGLSFLGACALAAFMTTVQRSHGVVSEQEVLWANFVTQSVLAFALTRHFEWYRWKTMLHMGPGQLGQVTLLAAGVNWGCNLVQQLCIRALGAPQAAAFLPVRLLGSLAASYPLLGESLEGPWQWGGAGVLLAAVTWYLLQQKEGARSVALAAAMAEADEGVVVEP